MTKRRRRVNKDGSAVFRWTSQDRERPYVAVKGHTASRKIERKKGTPRAARTYRASARNAHMGRS